MRRDIKTETDKHWCDRHGITATGDKLNDVHNTRDSLHRRHESDDEARVVQSKPNRAKKTNAPLM